MMGGFQEVKVTEKLSDPSKTFHVSGTNSILEFQVGPSLSWLTLANAGVLEA